MTTPIDKAIEAAAKEIEEQPLRCAGEAPINPYHSIRRHIMPVIEAMTADTAEALKIVGEHLNAANKDYRKAETELADLKALVREYLPNDDSHLSAPFCNDCSEAVSIDSDYLCQNPDCVAFKLREACK